MTNYKEIKISSNWTGVGLYGGLILILIMAPIIVEASQAQEFHFGMILAGLIYLGLVGLMIYQFMYVSSAIISGDKLVLKKQFRPAKSYGFHQIGYPTTFNYKSTKYITVEMTNDDHTTEKYLILNSRGIFAFENKDAEGVLIQLRNMKSD